MIYTRAVHCPASGRSVFLATFVRKTNKARDFFLWSKRHFAYGENNACIITLKFYFHHLIYQTKQTGVMQPASVLKEKVATRKAKRAREEEEDREALLKLVWQKMASHADAGYSAYTFPATLTGIAKQQSWSPPEYRLDNDTMSMIISAIKAHEGYTVEETMDGGRTVYTVRWL
jgi:hypothetical protein